jgi:hypothetical protein
LDNPVANANELALFINFVRQEPTTAYSASGTSLTLTSATSATDDMYCVFLGKAVQTVNPPNASVGTAQIADLAVTSGKLASGVLPTNTPAFFAYTNTNTNISNRTTTKVPLNATIYDSGSIFDTSNNRVTFGVAGKYMLHFGGTFGNTVINDANGLNIYLRKNGSIGLWSQGQTDYNGFTNHVSSVSGSLVVDASATDYYEIYMYIDVNTGTPAISGDSTEVRSYMGGYKIIE